MLTMLYAIGTYKTLFTKRKWFIYWIGTQSQQRQQRFHQYRHRQIINTEWATHLQLIRGLILIHAPMYSSVHLSYSLCVGHTRTDPRSWPALNINENPARWFGSFHDSFQQPVQQAINTVLSNVFYPTERGAAEATVDTIHRSVYLEGAELWLELVALVSMKSEVLMGQKWREGLKGLSV